MKRRMAWALALVAVLAGLLVVDGSLAAKPKPKPKPHKVHKAKKKPKPKPKPLTPAQKLAKVKHFVIIYEENHSFDNLYGGWEGVNGRSAATGANTTQVNQSGAPYTCLLQNDVNLTSPPLGSTCTDTTTGTSFTSAFSNQWYLIDPLIPPTATTCPPALGAFSFPNGVKNGSGEPGGCTRDLVHEFYQEQYQLNNGAQNRYVTGSDAIGMTMGVYDTKQLPIYQYLHQTGHPKYAIADNFFQAAFGGSFLNHQWLIAAATPTYPNPPEALRSIIDSNGMPVKYPLYNPTGTVRRGPITVACPSPVPNRACGDYAVNTMQPSVVPFGTFGAKLVPQTAPTIGDRLTDKGIDWAWYSGGWANAAGETTSPGYTNGAGPNCSDPNTAPGSTYPVCPNNVFQFHHQPFNYFANYAPGAPGRAHLKDEVEFMQTVQGSTSACNLKPVSFIKPLGQENEHPGYASEPNGSSHLVSLIQSIEGSKCAGDTMIIVTYDEFGGQWDHVSPPGQGTATGPHDQWGPGTRIPALVLSPTLSAPFVVDHSEHDTTSIVATLEHRYGLPALSSRDAAVADLKTVFSAKKP
jgi:acid phosphatase